MAKTLKSKPKAEVVPQDEDTSADDMVAINAEVDLPTGKRGGSRRVNLHTVGDVKREMAHAYRQCDRGKMTWANGTKAIWILRGVLAAAEVEEKYRIIDNTDEDTRPVFTGLQIVGPQEPDEGKD